MMHDSATPLPLPYVLHLVFAYLVSIGMCLWVIHEHRQRNRDKRRMDEQVERANRAAADEIARAGLRRMQTDEMRRIERRETIWG